MLRYHYYLLLPQSISSVSQITDVNKRVVATQQLADERFIEKYITFFQKQSGGSGQKLKQLQAEHFDKKLKPALEHGNLDKLIWNLEEEGSGRLLRDDPRTKNIYQFLGPALRKE
jgi:hypothetical protein